jgi:putative ABC transport system substrate-binding protein
MLRNIAVSLLLISGLFLLQSREAAAATRIGVLLYSEEARYYSSFEGIKKELAKAGFKEPKITFVVGDAGGSKAKATELVNRFNHEGLSLLITLGTNATIIAAREIRNVPIVFCMVYDPVAAGIAKAWKSSGTNATGVSPRIAMSELVKRLNEVRPAKKIAVLYTPGQENSEVQLKELQAEQQKMGFQVIPVIISHQEDIQQILPEVLPIVDSLYFSGSSIVGANIPEIVNLAAKAKVVTFSHLEDLVENGVMLGVAADPYQLGLITGRKAVAVLKGANPSSIPIEFMKNPQVYLNRKTAKATGIKLPDALIRKAKKVFE